MTTFLCVSCVWREYNTSIHDFACRQSCVQKFCVVEGLSCGNSDDLLYIHKQKHTQYVHILCTSFHESSSISFSFNHISSIACAQLLSIHSFHTNPCQSHPQKSVCQKWIMVKCATIRIHYTYTYTRRKRKRKRNGIEISSFMCIIISID